jgi:hypothetical protein
VTHSNDPDRPILIKTVVGTALLFLVLAGAAGGYLVAKDRVGLAGFLGVVVTGLVIGALAGWAIVMASGAAAGKLVQTLTGAGNIPPAPSFSYEEALVMQGKYGEAVDAFRARLVEHPTDLEARLALAALLAGPAKNPVEAEREFLLVRGAGPDERQERVSSEGLIDLYFTTGQRGRHMAELARFAERFRGTSAGEAAKRTLLELKQGDRLTDL